MPAVLSELIQFSASLSSFSVCLLSYMFYTDWSTSSRIGRADLDGQNRVLDLVSKKILHPHGITLDFAKQHLYWGDSFLDFIERIDYDGNHRTTIAYGLNVSCVA